MHALLIKKKNKKQRISDIRGTLDSPPPTTSSRVVGERLAHLMIKIGRPRPRRREHVSCTEWSCWVGWTRYGKFCPSVGDGFVRCASRFGILVCDIPTRGHVTWSERDIDKVALDLVLDHICSRDMGVDGRFGDF